MSVNELLPIITDADEEVEIPVLHIFFPSSFLCLDSIRILQPNGYVLLRDYAIGDHAQAMLVNKNRVISENCYFRGDGTCSFYFSEDLSLELFVTAGFTVAVVAKTRFT
ncbi:methyltransferase-like protein 6 [Artemisia annua]|uniref:Methyltransferase-like protein 6 n=1 Tax=Artemisia annua TaxID=35608 RepID=A0A2U1LTW1_ARTAN|nr:methyltransferase-like protein 6 [Artemisia annua]